MHISQKRLIFWYCSFFNVGGIFSEIYVQWTAGTSKHPRGGCHSPPYPTHAYQYKTIKTYIANHQNVRSEKLQNPCFALSLCGLQPFYKTIKTYTANHQNVHSEIIFAQILNQWTAGTAA